MNLSTDVFEAVLFDMDGVVIDTEEAVRRFWLALADRLAVRLTETDFRDHIYGRKAIYTLEKLFPPFDKREIGQFFLDLEVYEREASYKPIPGVIEFLRRLKRSGVRTALVTSAHDFKIAIVREQLGLDSLFDAVVNGDDIVEGKPHPDCYLLGARRLGTPPDKCIVFEDAKSGVEAAVAAGACCIGVNRQQDLPLSAGAAFVIPDFSGVQSRTDGELLWLDFGAGCRAALKTG